MTRAETPAPPGGGGGHAKKRKLPEGFFDNLRLLKDRYVLIHGTDTCWDGVNEMIIKVSHARLTWGSDVVKAWLNSPDRRMVNRDQVVFDPTERVDRRTHVNLFTGFELKPKPGSCALTLQLLEHLCGGDPAVYQWVLRWIAIQLQRPGTKLATAILMHGSEGTGKNQWWGAIQKLFGRYGAIIGQAQIESQFNGWLSAKLFILCNEVLGRREKWELKGSLKNLITEDLIYINEKNMPERQERNHANLVFLSNEIQPLVLGRGDRRNMVIECWQEHPGGKEFHIAVGDEIEQGGLEALLDYLLKLPLDGFGPHTKPLDTQAKRELVELGKDEAERFLEEWRAGATPYPYKAATAHDLYAAFRRWCAREGERHVPSNARFGRTAKLHLKQRVQQFPLFYGSREDKRPWRVYWAEDAVPDTVTNIVDWLPSAAQAFHNALLGDGDAFESRGGGAGNL